MCESFEYEHRYKQELERKLRDQQKQSEEDSRWLAEEENNLVSVSSNAYCSCRLNRKLYSIDRSSIFLTKVAKFVFVRLSNY